MDKSKNEPADLGSLPGVNQSPIGPSFRDHGPQGPQSTKHLGIKLVLTVVGAVVGFILIRLFL